MIITRANHTIITFYSSKIYMISFKKIIYIYIYIYIIMNVQAFAFFFFFPYVRLRRFPFFTIILTYIQTSVNVHSLLNDG